MSHLWLRWRLIGVVLSLALAGTATEVYAPPITAPPGPPGFRFNPLQIAILRWYAATQTSGLDYAVGIDAIFVAFDGESIWVTNSFSGTVTKLRASDGTDLGSFAVGDNPGGVAFDGANLWVTNLNSHTVTKLRASDGTCNGVANPPGSDVSACSFAMAVTPFGVAFDGANLWVARFGSNAVTKLRASDGANLGTFAVGSGPFGVAFDGANIWVANFHSNSVTKLRASDGANLGSFAVGPGPQLLAFDGANIWVPNGSNNVVKLRASDGTCAGVANPPGSDVSACSFAAGTSPEGVAFDGANIWVTNGNSATVSKR